MGRGGIQSPTSNVPFYVQKRPVEQDVGGHGKRLIVEIHLNPRLGGHHDRKEA